MLSSSKCLCHLSVKIREYRKMKDIIGELEALVEAVPA
jgi:hypothetical protein